MVEILLTGILIVLIIITRNIKLIGGKLFGNPDRKSNTKKDDERDELSL